VIDEREIKMISLFLWIKFQKQLTCIQKFCILRKVFERKKSSQ
ncbi:hypothetical protein CLOHIR_01575, partial [Peptacetobacter hiranonis DSM 13275]